MPGLNCVHCGKKPFEWNIMTLLFFLPEKNVEIAKSDQINIDVVAQLLVVNGGLLKSLELIG